MSDSLILGGCQCGAVRFSANRLENPSICHCRMCQKAFGGFYAPLAKAIGLNWTRGTPKDFRSSNRVTRGFCGDCGTPLTYDYGDGIEVAIGALDNPEIAAPLAQVNLKDKLSFVDGLHALPIRELASDGEEVAFMASIRSHQHPDHDTKIWPPAA